LVARRLVKPETEYSSLQQSFHSLDNVWRLGKDVARERLQFVSHDGLDVKPPFFGLGLKLGIIQCLRKRGLESLCAIGW
jgi:hypothetical protein